MVPQYFKFIIQFFGVANPVIADLWLRERIIGGSNVQVHIYWNVNQI